MGHQLNIVYAPSFKTILLTTQLDEKFIFFIITVIISSLFHNFKNENSHFVVQMLFFNLVVLVLYISTSFTSNYHPAEQKFMKKW